METIESLCFFDSSPKSLTVKQQTVDGGILVGHSTCTCRGLFLHFRQDLSLRESFRFVFNSPRSIATLPYSAGDFGRSSVLSRTPLVFFRYFPRIRYRRCLTAVSPTPPSRTISIDRRVRRSDDWPIDHSRAVRNPVYTSRASITRNGRLYLIYCRVPIFASTHDVPKLLY